MKKLFKPFLLIVVLGVFYSLFSLKDKNIFTPIGMYKLCLKHPFIDKITGCKEYFSYKLKLYRWINPKDETSLINKMEFQKTLISSSKEENPDTLIKILNFSSKSNQELGINKLTQNPLYYFSETYTTFSEKYVTPPVYFYTIKDTSIFIGNDTRKFLVFKNGFYTLMGRGNDSLERILSKLIEKEDVFYEEENRNIYFVKDFTELPEIKNKTVFFHGDWNLYHLIMEPSPGLLLINDTDYKINLSYSSKQNTDVVEALGNPYIIPTKLFSLERFSELIIPSPILEDNAHFPNIELMNKLIKKLQINFSEKTKITPLGKKIYVSRSDASRRKVLNELELMEHLEKRGFKMVIPGKYSVADQSKLFEEAEIIIGPHGMGLTNILFSNNLKTVIELFPTTWYPNCYLRTAQVKGVKNYYGLFHDAADPHTEKIFKILNFDFNFNIPEIDKILDSDFNVNIPEIIKILDELEE
jgi:hypothetical protein